jgi:hypothetical protein
MSTDVVRIEKAGYAGFPSSGMARRQSLQIVAGPTLL